MNSNIFRKYLNKEVTIGVADYKHQNRLFFYNGIVADIDDIGILLSIKDNEIFLSYDRIKELKPTPSGSGFCGRE